MPHWEELDPRIRAVQPAELRDAVEAPRAALVDAWEPRAWIARQTWTFARTVPDRPHWYVVADRSTDPAGARRFAALIGRTGGVEVFERRRYAYLTIDQWRYWVGPPGLINRKVADP